jgi:hypothetical protein
LILYHDRANFDQLDGMTWDGRDAGRIGLGVNSGGVPSPQGALYATSTDIRDRSGKVLAAVNPKDTAVFWADDGRHYCNLARTGSRDATSSAALQIVVPGHAPTDIARVGTFWPATFNAGGPYVVGCSIEADRAVIVQSGGQGLGTAQYWVVQLSTGQVTWTRRPDNGAVQLTASHDGRYIAENRNGQTTVYSPDGTVVGQLNAWVSLFSWDGTLAVTSPTWMGGAVAVMRWRDKTVVWRGPEGAAYGFVEGLAEPGGTRIALGIRDPAFPQTGGFPPVDLYTISPDGTVVFERKNIYLFPPL